MVIPWGVLSTKSRHALKVGWLITAGLVALYVGVIEPRDRYRGITKQKGTGLAAVSGQGEWQPISLWRQTSIFPRFALDVSYDRAVMSSHPSRMISQASLMAPQAAGGSGNGNQVIEDRKLLRTAALDMIVRSPAQTSAKIVQLVQAAGGFLLSSQVNGGADAMSATLSIRVPAARFEDVRAQIRILGTRVDSEGLEAQDVTKQYVDQEARLHNLREQEQQYLGILRKAVTVKDTLEVQRQAERSAGSH
jgi:hypothetical protein